MTIATSPTQPLLLDVSTTTLTVTQEQFLSLCIQNPDLRLELIPNRELIVMPRTLSVLHMPANLCISQIDRFSSFSRC